MPKQKNEERVEELIQHITQRIKENAAYLKYMTHETETPMPVIGALQAQLEILTLLSQMATHIALQLPRGECDAKKQ